MRAASGKPRAGLVLAAAMLAASLLPAPCDAKERLALVIGNSSYQSRPLASPRQDASDMASVLEATGFSVTLLLDADQETMEVGIRTFGERLHADSVGLFYFSGHGVQYGGNNYLIPVGALTQISVPDQLRYKAVSLGYILATMSDADNDLNLVFLDACRDNPFPGMSKGLEIGLAPVLQAEGTLIAYATGPGQIALDGLGPNSPYTESLVRLIRETALPIEFLLKRVREEVKLRTHDRQTPWYEASIGGDFAFRSVQGPEKVLAPEPGYTPSAREERLEGEVVLQAVVSETGDVEDIEVLKGLELGLTEAAIEAFRSWKFRPALHNGTPISAIYTNTFIFSLKKGAAPPEGD